MSKITKQQNGVLSVPDVPTIPFITGDGVGAEITPAMQAIVDAAVVWWCPAYRMERSTGR